MNENKFRSWDKEINAYRNKGTIQINDSGKPFILTPTGWEFIGGIIIEFYTGLKDKNGKDIYEGDIVEIRGETKVLIATNESVKDPHYEIGSIDFKDGMFVTKWTHGKNSWFGEYPHFNPAVSYCGYYQIIGNIHENPELCTPS